MRREHLPKIPQIMRDAAARSAIHSILIGSSIIPKGRLSASNELSSRFSFLSLADRVCFGDTFELVQVSAERGR